MQTDDGRNVERPGHDRRVGGSAPCLRGKPQSHLAVEKRGIRGGKIVGQNDAGSIERVDIGKFATQQIVDHPPTHIENIGGSLTEVGILYLPQTLGVGVDDMLVDMLDADFPHLHLLADRGDDGAVAGDQKVCLKDSRLLLPDGTGKLFFDFLNLLPRLEKSGFKPSHFIFDLILANRRRMNSHLFMGENRQLSADDTWRGGNPGEPKLGARDRKTVGWAHKGRLSPLGLLFVELSFD